MDPEIADRLRQRDDAFAKAPVAGTSGEMPPDGQYQAVLNRFDFIDTKNGLKLLTELTVAVGDYSGWNLTTWHDLEDPDKFKWLKAHLVALEVPEPPSLTDLDFVLKGALDAPYLVTVKRGDAGYANAYIEQRLGGPLRSDVPVDASDFTQTGSVPTDDGVPF